MKHYKVTLTALFKDNEGEENGTLETIYISTMESTTLAEINSIARNQINSKLKITSFLVVVESIHESLIIE